MNTRKMQDVLRENANLKREIDRLRGEARRNVSAGDELVLARRKIDDLLAQLDSTYQRNFTLNKKVIRLESRVKELKAENNPEFVNPFKNSSQADSNGTHEALMQATKPTPKAYRLIKADTSTDYDYILFGPESQVVKTGSFDEESTMRELERVLNSEFAALHEELNQAHRRNANQSAELVELQNVLVILEDLDLIAESYDFLSDAKNYEDFATVSNFREGTLRAWMGQTTTTETPTTTEPKFRVTQVVKSTAPDDNENEWGWVAEIIRDADGEYAYDVRYTRFGKTCRYQEWELKPYTEEAQG
jgi:chaperonin cofactor prefoldin